LTLRAERQSVRMSKITNDGYATERQEYSIVRRSFSSHPVQVSSAWSARDVNVAKISLKSFSVYCFKSWWNLQTILNRDFKTPPTSDCFYCAIEITLTIILTYYRCSSSSFTLFSCLLYSISASVKRLCP